MKFQLITCVAFLGFAISCKPTPATITPFDFEAIFATANANGVTVKEADSLSFLVAGLLQKNTEGKKLPALKITDLKNRETNLQELITGETIILSSDIHCAMAIECLQ